MNKNTELARADERFSAAQRQITREVARDLWVFAKNSKIDEQDDARFIGTLLSLLVTTIGAVSSVISFSGAVAGTSPRNTVRINLRLQNLTPYILVMRELRHSNSRLWSAASIQSGQTVEFPYTIGARRADRPSISMSLVGENGILMTVNFVIFDNHYDVRVREARFDHQVISAPVGVNLMGNRPMIFRGNPIHGLIPTLVCSSVKGGVPNQSLNIDVALITAEI